MSDLTLIEVYDFLISRGNVLRSRQPLKVNGGSLLIDKYLDILTDLIDCDPYLTPMYRDYLIDRIK